MMKIYTLITSSIYSAKKISYKKGLNFRILSIDGGGMRGIASSIVLDYMEKTMGKQTYEMFDLIAGTSTGGILATLLTLPSEGRSNKARFTAKEALNEYIKVGPQIFKRNRWSLTGATYSAKSKRQSIQRITKERRIKDLITDLIITSYDTLEGTPYYFQSKCAQKNDRCNYLLTDMCDATSAAPTYFSPVYVSGQDSEPGYGGRNFVDGGLVTNSPVMAAISHAIKDYGVHINDIVVLSLGTGQTNKYHSKETVDGWGLIKWGLNLPDIFLSSTASSNNFQAEQVLRNNAFLRVNFDILDPGKGKLDDASPETFNYLIKKGNEMVNLFKPKINNFLKYL